MEETKEFEEALIIIENETKLIVGTDKTSNYYKVDPKDYKKLMKKNVEAEHRVFKTTNRECFVTLKDLKYNLKNGTNCRLLNPTKSEF